MPAEVGDGADVAEVVVAAEGGVGLPGEDAPQQALLHLARPAAGEEMDDDRDRGREEPEEEQRVEKAQRGYSTNLASESSQSSTPVTGWISQNETCLGNPPFGGLPSNG